MWPRWAEPDNGAVFFFIILPFYAIYYFVFPVVWCPPPPHPIVAASCLPLSARAHRYCIGYFIYSFQLFPISRISNRWLHAFTYSFVAPHKGVTCHRFISHLRLTPPPPPSGFEHPFDSSDAIILPMVQKGKLEETMLEAVPQMAVQIINSYWSSSPASVITILSISFSALSLLNTIWFYAYWQFYRCKRTRDVPSPLALYNYKLDGVRDGIYSFSKPQKEVSRAEAMSFNPSVMANSRTLDNTLSKEKEKTVVRDEQIAIELIAGVGDEQQHHGVLGRGGLAAVELPPRVRVGGGGGVFEEVGGLDAADAIAAAVTATRKQCKLEAAAEMAALKAEVERLKHEQQQQQQHQPLRSRASLAVEGGVALEFNSSQSDQQVIVILMPRVTFDALFVSLVLQIVLTLRRELAAKNAAQVPPHPPPLFSIVLTLTP